MTGGLYIEMGYHDKHYGLTGQTIMVRERQKISREEVYEAYRHFDDLSEEEIDEIDRASQAWKFTWGGLEVPVFVNGEYRKFFDCTVLPHRNIWGGISRPYPVTIDKFDIFKGIVIINGGAIK